MSRIKTMMDLHPAYRAYVDLRRSKEGRRELHWLQLTAQQREKEREGREQAHAQEPAPAANAHGASSTEQQDMLDKGMEMLQQMRAGFGME
jgi:protein-disulfide isomerase-like protein with CxxC motif